MKKITVKHVLQATDIGDDVPTLTAFELEGPEEMEASDGSHTFGELYEHRYTLFIALCNVLMAGGFYKNPCVWRSKIHSDGSSYDGSFILGINKDKGNQITYHLPLSKWDETDFAETLEKAPEWDGHTSKDVLDRLAKL